MRSVNERIQDWEAKSLQAGAPKPEFNLNPSHSSSNQPIIRDSAVLIENRLTQMSDARKILETMQSKNGNMNLLPNVPLPRTQMIVSQQPFGRISNNEPGIMKNADDSTLPGNYEKQFLNIRGTLNLAKKDEPLPPRNTVNVGYDSQILKPSKLKQMMSVDTNRQKTVDFASNVNKHSANQGVLLTLQQKSNNHPLPSPLLKSEVIKIDKGVHYRTQKLINALFGQEQVDEFRHPKNSVPQGGMTNLANPRSEAQIPKFRSTKVPVTSIQSNGFQSHGQQQNKKTIGNFDNL